MSDAAMCASLPSSEAAFDLVAGDMSALPRVAGTMAMRAGLIAAGILIAGEREHVIRNAVGGAVAIEAFVIGWALFKQSQARKAAT